MPTYEQLRSERVHGRAIWDREIVTDAMETLRRELARGLRLDANRIGFKGDNNHLYGAHRSQEWFLMSRYSTSRHNTFQAGLSELQSRYIAGVDISPDSKTQLLAICRNVDHAVRSGYYEMIRAWYGNINGDQRVDGYNNIENRAASADSSHLTHLHLTLDRALVDSPAAMRQVRDAILGRFNSTPTPTTEVNMRGILGNVKGKATIWYGTGEHGSLRAIRTAEAVASLQEAGAVRHTFSTPAALVDACGARPGATVAASEGEVGAAG